MSKTRCCFKAPLSFNTASDLVGAAHHKKVYVSALAKNKERKKEKNKRKTNKKPSQTKPNQKNYETTVHIFI